MTNDNNELASALAETRAALVSTYELLDHVEQQLGSLPEHPLVLAAAAHAHRLVQDTRRLTNEASAQILGWTT